VVRLAHSSDSSSACYYTLSPSVLCHVVGAFVVQRTIGRTCCLVCWTVFVWSFHSLLEIRLHRRVSISLEDLAGASWFPASTMSSTSRQSPPLPPPPQPSPRHRPPPSPRNRPLPFLSLHQPSPSRRQPPSRNERPALEVPSPSRPLSWNRQSRWRVCTTGGRWSENSKWSTIDVAPWRRSQARRFLSARSAA